MTEQIVTTHGLTKRYGDRFAVDHVSLNVLRGEAYGFLGPNGAGKTTTLRMLLGLVRPSDGTANVLGHRTGSPAAVTRLGSLVEEPGFYPYLSGRDNLRVMARYRALAVHAVDRALEQVDLAARGHEPFRAYSLGMKQRLGVAAALLGEPELLVLDEPTNGLDPAGMADMRRLIRALADSGQTVLLSSHLLAEVQEICDRVGVISRGRLLTQSTVAELRGATSLIVRATPADRALSTAMHVAGDDAVHLLSDEAMRLDVPTTQAPAIARALVSADVDVHQIRTTERSLEDVFFEMTSADKTEEVAA